MRQTRALGLSNVTYAQADLLQLGSLDRRFDLIESSGVLHHLADPLAGWRVLAALLRPGGLMRLGFYSERARADVVAGRAFVASRGRGATAEDIRKIRQEILRSFDPVLRNLTRFRDFFSTSECRDLLFHIQEHRLTLPQIEANLAELRLDFLGFVLDAATVRRFHARHPDPRTATDLGAWHRFECDYPETFSAMYQFWAQSRPKA